MDSWYCHFGQGTGFRTHVIQAACIYHKHWKLPNHTLEAHNGYYLELDTRTDTWNNVWGEELSMPLTKEVADEKIRVFDTESTNSRFQFLYTHPGSVAMDMSGRPHLLFKIAVEGGLAGCQLGRGQKKLFYTRWDGEKWTELVPVSGEALEDGDMNEDGDIVANSPSDIQVVFAVNNETHVDISYWETTNGGVTWEKGESLYVADISVASEMKTSRFIRNGHAGARIAAYAEIPNTEGMYRQLLLLKDDGPIRRAVKDADICQGFQVSDTGSLCIAPAPSPSPSSQPITAHRSKPM
jgi:hypothetical protein